MNWPAATGLIALAGLCVGLPAMAGPFVPADNNQVLESGLPTADPRVRQMRTLSGELQQRPDDLATAMRLASRQLAMGVAEADPRFVGYAGGRWRAGGGTTAHPRRFGSCARASCRPNTISPPLPPICAPRCAMHPGPRRRCSCWRASTRSPAI
jgi:hypothetical protein